jgi:catechol 2,3-dioxygenase-like lactoylglutathione lyase family enzyme
VLHHVLLWVPDLERASEPWTWLLDRLGYVADRQGGDVLLFRHPSGFTLALESSSDMVPGMLYSRFRPGLNHVAFRVESAGGLDAIVADAGEHGWSVLPGDRHPIAGGARVAYLEDIDGYEVELVEPDVEGLTQTTTVEP